MTASMTAFSRLQRDYPAGRLVWEIRSVNHRYLDIHIKLPESLRMAEPGCRDRINDALARGRIDAALGFEPASGSIENLEVNESAVRDMARVLKKVEGILPAPQYVNPLEVLRWPEVLMSTERDHEALCLQAQELLTDALKELIEVRLREGTKLASLIRERIDSARTIIHDLKTTLPDIEEDLKNRWMRRLQELGTEVDPARMAQEQALLLTRADVGEELDRLEAHLAEVGRILDGKGAGGRRMEFLMQELNREANTLGAKSNDLRNTSAAVDLKVLIDQMREQVQNME